MRQHSSGFTLIELLTVVALASVMMAVGIPSFKSFVAGQRVKTATGEFSSAATFARSEAIKRNAEVGLFAATGGWGNGWSVKVGTTSLGEQLAYSGITMSSGVTEVVYLGSGRLKEQATATSVQVNGTGTDAVRCVAFELSGLPKTRLGACS
jgi:type IV fimbrial biogenesis protein FimT